MPDSTQPHLYDRLRAMSASGQKAKGLLGFLQGLIQKGDLQRAGTPATPGAPPAASPTPAVPPINAALPTDRPDFRITPTPASQAAGQPLSFSDAFRQRAAPVATSIMPPLPNMAQPRPQAPITSGVGRFIKG